MKIMSFRKPVAESIRQFRQAQATLDFTYSAVGATATNPPADCLVIEFRHQVTDDVSVKRNRRWHGDRSSVSVKSFARSNLLDVFVNLLNWILVGFTAVVVSKTQETT